MAGFSEEQVGRDGAPGVLRRWGDQTGGYPGEVDKVLVQDLVEVVLGQVRLLVTSSSSFFFFAFCSCCSFFPWPSSFRFSAATKKDFVSILQEQRSNKVAEDYRTTLTIEGTLYRLSLERHGQCYFFRGGFNILSFPACILRVASFLTLSQLADVRKGTMEGGQRHQKPRPMLQLLISIMLLKTLHKYISFWKNNCLE